MAKKLSSFEQAFADARKKYLAGTGPKNFTFNGELYNTNLAGEGLKKAEDTPPSTSRQSVPPRAEFSGGIKSDDQSSWDSPVAKTKARSLVDQGRDVGIYKNVDKEAVLNAGLGLASLYPGTIAARTAYGVARPLVGAAAKYLSKKDSPVSSKARDEDPPLFTSKEKPESGVFDDVSPREFKKGGSVKLSEAARRGDGIAIRGRTKGRLC